MTEAVASARVLRFDSIGSTNEEGLRLGREGERGPLWLRADVQTSGRGRLGRNWASPVGNLYTTLLLHAPGEPRVLPHLAHVAAVALARAAATASGVDFTLKWPNDLLHGAAKVAGILVEGTQDVVQRPVCVIGMGVNCASHPEGLPYPASSLSRAAGRPVTADALFTALRKEMAEALRLWDGGRDYASIRDAWLDHALPFGTTMTVRAAGAERHGTFQGIDLQGRLLLGGPDGLTTIEAGDIFLSEGSATAG